LSRVGRIAVTIDPSTAAITLPASVPPTFTPVTLPRSVPTTTTVVPDTAAAVMFCAAASRTADPRSTAAIATTKLIFLMRDRTPQNMGQIYRNLAERDNPRRVNATRRR
jgi:hypothetical protein